MSNDTQTSDQKILTKIKKLKAMEESARKIGNEAEALAFASRVQQLLHSYKLEMAQVDEIDLGADDAIEVDREFFAWDEAGIERTRKQSHWLLQLSMYVCQYNNCRCHGIIKSNKVAIIGTEASRAVVTWLLVTLARYGRQAMEESYRKEYYLAKKDGDERRMKGYRRAFVSAYVSRVGMRLKEQWESDQAANCTERGLMVIDKEKAAVETFMASLELRPNSFRGAYNQQGARDGAQAGERATIQCNGVRGQENRKIR